MRLLAPRGVAAKPDFLITLLVVSSLSTHGLAQTVSAQSPAPDAQERHEPNEDEHSRWHRLRAGSTYHGPVGGVYVVDAGSGAAGTVRLGVATDFFIKRDYLTKGDVNRYFGGVLSLSATPIEHLELSAAITTRSNRNTMYQPDVVQVVGDLHFDVKGYFDATPGLTLGADAMVTLLNNQTNAGVAFDSPSVGLRGNLAFDFRELVSDALPLQVRLNAGYVFDNSANTVDDLENARFRDLIVNGPLGTITRRPSYEHLLDRRERLAFGINRVDRVSVGVGVELPFEVNEKFAIHPLAEWQLDVPVNRQAFTCPYVVDRAGNQRAGTDSCLDREGPSSFPQHILVGARIWPVAGLNVLAAVDVGLTGTSNFVQELAPQPPYRVVLGLGYTIDPKPTPRRVPPTIKEVEKRVEVAAIVPPTGRIQGTIVEQDTNTAVADARVSFSGKDVTPLWAGAEGRFVSYAFAPGEVNVDIEAAGYQRGQCSAIIPPAGGDVPVTCTLVALPRLGGVKGQVLDAAGAPLAAVRITLAGPQARTIMTDSSGKFAENNLQSGEYSARIEQEGYFVSVTQVMVKQREETAVSIQLAPLPKSSAVVVKKDKIQIRSTVFFKAGTAEIEKRSEPLLAEIADAMMRHPDVLKVEVQGHTDDRGPPKDNVELSQRRAESVRTWLMQAGVEGDRLVAKGYGAEKPLAPNITSAARARNRRVEFMITERSAE